MTLTLRLAQRCGVTSTRGRARSGRGISFPFTSLQLETELAISFYSIPKSKLELRFVKNQRATPITN